MNERRYVFRVLPANGKPSVIARGFPDDNAARAHADAIGGANYGRACIEVFRERDPADVVLYRVGARPVQQ